MADARLLLVTHLIAAGVGYQLAPRELLETEVTHTGFFQVDSKRVLSAAVESLRAEQTMTVLSHKGFAAVSVERDGLLFLDGRQDLIVPASVTFGVDLSRLTLDDVSYDEASKLITVRLPPLVMGDVAFEPEGARTLNGGLLTFSQRQVEVLTRLNYASARRAFIKQAQGAALVEAAKQHARTNVETNLLIPLRAIGEHNVRVVATFDR